MTMKPNEEHEEASTLAKALGYQADALAEMRLQRDYWRAKDKVRAAGEAYVRTGDVPHEERRRRYDAAKRRLRTAREALKAAGVRP